MVVLFVLYSLILNWIFYNLDAITKTEICVFYLDMLYAYSLVSVQMSITGLNPWNY